MTLEDHSQGVVSEAQKFAIQKTVTLGKWDELIDLCKLQ